MPQRLSVFSFQCSVFREAVVNDRSHGWDGNFKGKESAISLRSKMHIGCSAFDFPPCVHLSTFPRARFPRKGIRVHGSSHLWLILKTEHRTLNTVLTSSSLPAAATTAVLAPPDCSRPGRAGARADAPGYPEPTNDTRTDKMLWHPPWHPQTLSAASTS
jgi:hypothetical protein